MPNTMNTPALWSIVVQICIIHVSFFQEIDAVSRKQCHPVGELLEARLCLSGFERVEPLQQFSSGADSDNFGSRLVTTRQHRGG